MVDLNQENETDKLNRFKCDMISNLSRISELTSQLNLNIEKINKKSQPKQSDQTTKTDLIVNSSLGENFYQIDKLNKKFKAVNLYQFKKRNFFNSFI